MKVMAALTTALLLIASSAFSEQQKPLIKYGTSCYRAYGGRNEGNISKAIISVKKYFAHRGFGVKILGHSRRYIRADIYKDDEQVDSIVVDITTGKMRSVY